MQSLIDIDTALLGYIAHSFGLDLAYRYSSIAFDSVFPLPSQPYGNDWFKSYSFCYHTRLNLAWSQNLNTQSIQGICFGQRDQIIHLQSLLPAIGPLANQPMGIALLSSLLLGEQVERDLYNVKQQVREVETRMGCHPMSDLRLQPASGNLWALSAQMSACSSKLASVSRKIKTVQEVVEFIIGEVHIQDNHSSPMAASNISLSPPPPPPSQDGSRSRTGDRNR